MTEYEMKKKQWAIAIQCEQAMIEAIEEKIEFTIIGFFGKQLHVPALGLIL